MEAAPAIKDFLGDKFIKRGENNTLEEITFDKWHSEFSKKGKYIGLYFGAHWAPPCRLFFK